MMKTNHSLPMLCAGLLLHGAVAIAETTHAPDEVPGTTRVTAEEVVGLVRALPDLVIIDARKADRYRGGHIQGAVNLLDTQLNPTALASHASDKATPLLFYCNGARCLRSSNAAAKAVRWGYTKVYWFKGGWQEWADKEMPVAR